jgi:hypothetical protein
MRAKFEPSTPELDRAQPELIAQPEPSAAETLGYLARPALAQLLLPGDAFPNPVQRLVVLVPDADTDEPALASQIWTMASARGLSILYLTVAYDVSTVYRAMRRLAHLSAITRDDRVSVETQIAEAGDWVPAVRACWRPGDLVICHAEQSVGLIGWRRPLSQVLLGRLSAPVCILSGFYAADQLVPRNPVMPIAAWVVPLLIIGLFFWLQARIVQLPDSSFESLLLLSSVLIEFCLIWLWHRFTMGPP